MSAKARRAAIGLVLVLGVGLCWAMLREPPREAVRVQAPAVNQEGREAVAPGEAIGNLAAGAAAEPAANKPAAANESDSELLEMRAGTTQPVPLNLNPQVRSVAEAIQTKTHPERLSTLIQPASFNAEAFRADPESYLNTAEPARVFQPAQPGPGVKQLTALSPYFQSAEQGKPVSLQVLAAPGAPVTFTSFDLGEFSNRLTTITVRADADGVAEAQFTGTPGTIERVNILAASPLTSGQAKYVVHVTLPEAAAK